VTENKDPSYPWYPRDFEADEPVKMMTLAQEGAYRRLLDHQWLNGSIPGDVKELASICKNVSAAEMKKIWPVVSRCFVHMDGLPVRLQNRKMERVRQERKEHRDKQIASGKKGAEARWKDKQTDGDPIATAVATPMAKDSSALALASALAEESTTTSASRPADEPTDGQIMATIREHLYAPDGRPPEGWEEGREFSIMRQLRKLGKSGSQITNVVEGLGCLLREGRVDWLKGKATLRAVFNSKSGVLDMWGQAEDAYYRQGATYGKRAKSSPQDIRAAIQRELAQAQKRGA
jgi:uncharacterized protein YdaU (DUF1376 family)